MDYVFIFCHTSYFKTNGLTKSYLISFWAIFIEGIFVNLAILEINILIYSKKFN